MTTKNEGTQRDELATLIVCEAYRRRGFAELTTPPAQQDRELADAILAAGYRKPRTITTVEELDALPDGSVARSRFGELLELRVGLWYFGDDAGDSPTLPAIVLYEPGAEATQ